MFLPCTFWLADNYALIGRQDEARALFERVLGLANDVGLLAEEYDPCAGRQLGNIPQAFTHIAYVQAARLVTEGVPENRPFWIAPSSTRKRAVNSSPGSTNGVVPPTAAFVGTVIGSSAANGRPGGTHT